MISSRGYSTISVTQLRISLTTRKDQHMDSSSSHPSDCVECARARAAGEITVHYYEPPTRMDSYRRDGIAPTESAAQYQARDESSHGYAYTLRDPETLKVVFRTDDAELAQRYARALALATLQRFHATNDSGAVRTLIRRALGAHDAQKG
jgi:hypothetical protein